MGIISRTRYTIARTLLVPTLFIGIGGGVIAVNEFNKAADGKPVDPMTFRWAFAAALGCSLGAGALGSAVLRNRPG